MECKADWENSLPPTYILIGSLDCLSSLWWVKIITLILVRKWRYWLMTAPEKFVAQVEISKHLSSQNLLGFHETICFSLKRTSHTTDSYAKPTTTTKTNQEWWAQQKQLPPKDHLTPFQAPVVWEKNHFSLHSFHAVMYCTENGNGNGGGGFKMGPQCWHWPVLLQNTAQIPLTEDLRQKVCLKLLTLTQLSEH